MVAERGLFAFTFFRWDFGTKLLSIHSLHILWSYAAIVSEKWGYPNFSHCLFPGSLDPTNSDQYINQAGNKWNFATNVDQIFAPANWLDIDPAWYFYFDKRSISLEYDIA